MSEGFIQAIQAGDMAAVQQQLEREPALAHARDASGVHALAHAARAQNADAVRELLARGSDPRAASDAVAGGPAAASDAAALVRDAALSADTREANAAAPHAENPAPHLPPPEIARMIPCKFYPNCRYGDRCVFQHPTGPVGDVPQPVFFSGPGLPFPPPPPGYVPPPFVDMQPVFPVYGAGGVPFFPQLVPPAEEPRAEPDADAAAAAAAAAGGAAGGPAAASAAAATEEPRPRKNAPGKPKREATRGRAPGARPSCIFFARTACRYANECRFPHILPDGTDARLKDDDKARAPEGGTATPPRGKKTASVRGRGGSTAVRGKPRRGGAPANPRKTVQRVPHSDEFPALPGAPPVRHDEERTEPKANFSAILSAPAPKKEPKVEAPAAPAAAAQAPAAPADAPAAAPAPAPESAQAAASDSAPAPAPAPAPDAAPDSAQASAPTPA